MSLSTRVDQFGFPCEEEIKQPKVPAQKQLDEHVMREHDADLRRRKREAENRLLDLQEQVDRAVQLVEEEEEPWYAELSDSQLEEFTNGILTALGVMAERGEVPPIDTPAQAREALLAVVRELYRNKSVLAKFSHAFARYGAKQFVRRQKRSLKGF